MKASPFTLNSFRYVLFVVKTSSSPLGGATVSVNLTAKTQQVVLRKVQLFFD